MKKVTAKAAEEEAKLKRPNSSAWAKDSRQHVFCPSYVVPMDQSISETIYPTQWDWSREIDRQVHHFFLESECSFQGM